MLSKNNSKQGLHCWEDNLEKEKFDIDVSMGSIREAVKLFPKAALFELAEEGYRSPFEQLIACILSIRTRDEVTIRLARQLFAQSRTPLQISRLSIPEIEQLIYGTTFRERKAIQIRHIAEQVVDEHQGELPCDEVLIFSFPGVGVKCANLTLGIACGRSKISVDIHVHRVTNRWGYVKTTSP